MEIINQQIEENKKHGPGSSLFKLDAPAEDGYTKIPNHLIEHPRLSADAFRLLCHLLSRPQGWTVQKGDLMKRLKMGWVRLWRALNQLGQRKLVKRIIQQRPNNTFANNGYIVSGRAFKDQQILEFMAEINTNSK